MSDSDSDVDFDIEVPKEVKKIRKGKSPKAIPYKKSRPLHQSNNGMEDSDGSPERIPQSARNANKRPANAAVDTSSSSDNSSPNEEPVANRGKSIENHPPVGGGRPNSKRRIDDDDSQDEQEDQDAGNKAVGRARKRLSLRPNRSSTGNGLNISRTSSLAPSSVSNGPPPDRQTLNKIYSKCIEMFQTHKITLDNAFQMRFLDLMSDIIEMPDFDKNDMHGAGRALEAGARIYVCRVDKTKNSVMDLASTLSLQKKKNKQQGDDQGEENDMGNQTMGGEDNDDQPKKVKKRKKLKENRNVAEDESKLSADLEDHSSKAASRREGLKKKFNDMVDDDLDFDFSRYFYSSKDPSPLTKPEELRSYIQPCIVADTIINHAEIKNLEFIQFALAPDFDPATLNIWGLPIDPESILEEHDDVLPLPEPEPLANGDDLAYNPDDRPVDYGPEDLEAEDNNDTFVNEEGEVVDIKGRPMIDPRRITDLQEFYDMYLNIKSKYGWCGPTFVRPQLNFLRRNANPGEKKPRRRKDPIIIDYKEVIHEERANNKYDTDYPEKTVFDERTIEKWSHGGKNVDPFIGIEDCDDDLNETYEILVAEDKPASENFIPTLFRYFLDPNRNILGSLQNMVKNEVEGEVYPYDREEDDYIADAGFDIERNRDMGDDGGHDGDGPLDIDDHNFSFNASFGLPASLGGVLMDTDMDPISKASDGDSIKFTKKPKPIDMHALKRSILHFLEDTLQIQKDGQFTNEEETTTTLSALVIEVCKTVDKKMSEHLSIAIIVVGLMHVVVDKKLFMVVNALDPSNPLIVCRGTKWKHSENIPLPKNYFSIFGNERDTSS